MKYNSRAIAMTDKERQHWNETIIAAIEQTDTENYPFTPEEVYNRYSGKGGLHGLDRNDFENYYAYSVAKKELEQGQFFTPHNLCRDIVRAIQPPDEFLIADLTCGMGNFFNHLPNEENIYGNELEETAYKVCRLLYLKAHLENRDFLYYDPKVKLDLIIGNPPFNLQTGEGLSQWVYIQKAIELLQYGGLLAIIIPDSFLKDTFSEGHKINWINKHFNFIVQCKIPDNSFDANIDTKLLILQKKGVTDTYTTYQPENYISFEPEQIYTNIIAPIYEQYKKDTAKRYLLTVQNGIDNADLRYEIKKCLWHIKSNPVLNKQYYQKALEKIELLTTQLQPYGMKDKEWEHSQLTAEKVYHYLQSILKNQNKKEPTKKMRIVKTCYGLRLKAYVRKLENKGWEKSVHDLLLNGERFKPFKKLYDRKRKELDIQNTPFALLQRDEKIDSFLAIFKLSHQRPTPTGLFFEQFKAPTICLNDMQKQDIGLLLQKKYSILSWEQGGGKSVAGMTWMKFLEGKYNNCFLLAPALALNTTWKERLYTYGYNYILIESISDIYKIKKGQIVLISYDRLVTLQRHIKKHVKIQGYKIALLVDESDELTNASSKRSKAALNCFRKAKYKLLTTGTTTRNNINEIYTQMELLYNNSTAFICWAEKVYRVNKNNEVEEEQNGRVGYPFPAFRGAGLFKSCFCPQKSTVLGIKKDTQDIYNSEVLKDLINKTVITRKFEEIVGEKKYSIHTHSIKQSQPEQQLYQTLLTEFMHVCYDFYT